MDTVRVLFRFIGKKHLFIILMSLLLLPVVARSQTNEASRERIVYQVAQKWIQIGTEQYERGLYKASEQSLLKAKDYQKYLSAAEREKLDELLNKVQSAAIEKGRVSKNKEAAADSQLNGRRRGIAEIYNSSVEFYNSGALEKAREGFLKIAGNDLLVAPAGQRAEDYLAKIDKVLAQRNEFSITAEPVRKVEKFAISSRSPAAVAVSPTDEGSFINVVTRKRNVRRSHTQAVVNDAIAKARRYISQGEFDKAKEVIAAAERVLSENRLDLEEGAFEQYSDQCRRVNEQIIRAQKETAERLGIRRNLEAIDAQNRFTAKMEADRQRRIAELMENAITFQKQQRYEDAVGQLENLLAIDPLHDSALTLKQTLEDTISFRRQLELQKEAGEERVELLMKIDEAGIPYAEEITHPKNWREIDAKRRAEEVIGEDLANIAVRKQLNEIVDLSNLTPDTSFGEAIDELKNSVSPAMMIVVLWRDLEYAEVDQTTPINMDAMTAVPLGTALKILLESVSGGYVELDHIVENGVIKIATKESLKEELMPLVYDVSVLVGRPADFYVPVSGGGAGGGGGGGGGGRGGGGGAGGGGGGGAGGGAGGAGGGQFFAEYFDIEEEELGREELLEQMETRKADLIALIESTVEPSSWETLGGEGTIIFYENKKLIIRQTREIHNQIRELLEGLRKALGHQVSIEARFLIVTENFLEDIGFDFDFKIGGGDKWSILNFEQGHANFTEPDATGIRGSLGLKEVEGVTVPTVQGIKFDTNYIIDDLRANFLIRATQAHQDSKALAAPKVTVLSGESATIRIQRTIRYALVPDVSGGFGGYGGVGGGGGFVSGLSQNYGSVLTGTILNITPTIMPDRKHVLLNIVAELRDFLGFETSEVQVPAGESGEISTYQVQLPQTEISRVMTRVSMPDSGTLLLGGQKITAEVEREAGVPILSKIPILGRAFSNRSKIKDQRVLLILVKPTIMLQEEVDAEAIAAM